MKNTTILTITINIITFFVLFFFINKFYLKKNDLKENYKEEKTIKQIDSLKKIISISEQRTILNFEKIIKLEKQILKINEKKIIIIKKYKENENKIINDNDTADWLWFKRYFAKFHYNSTRIKSNKDTLK